MKSTLDLILERLELMTDDEIVNATNYSSDIGTSEIQLDGYFMSCSIRHSINNHLEYKQVELKHSVEYNFEKRVKYNEKIVNGYKTIMPLAA